MPPNEGKLGSTNSCPCASSPVDTTTKRYKLIFAVNYKRAREFAARNKFTLNEWFYVPDPDRLRGILNADLYWLEDTYLRSDYLECVNIINHMADEGRLNIIHAEG